jgi:NACalpha-BTF3-like transcription factor
MKKIILSLMAILVIMFTGCSVMDEPYSKAKAVYGVGKAVYKVQPVKSNKLEAVDGVATKYDDTRTMIRQPVKSNKLEAVDGVATKYDDTRTMIRQP